MKKILIVILLVWFAYLVYLNFFYTGSKTLCKMSLSMASAIIIPLFAGILWIGLPFSYLLKFIFAKIFKFSSTKNQFLQIFLTISKPVLLIFLLPFIFGIMIFFEAFSSLPEVIFANNYLFFAVQFLGLIYIHLSFSGKFNKYLIK